MNGISLYFQLAWVSIRAQMQYRINFLLLVIGNFCSSCIEFLGVWAFFHRFGQLGSWTLPEVGVFYGIVNIAFALSEMFARGFDIFQNHVRNGDFDRVLLRPRAASLQVLGGECQIMRIGRLLQGVMILLWSCAHLSLAWDVTHWFLLLEAVSGGALLFTGIAMMQATSCFWTVQSLEIWNTMTYGGVYATQYPMDIYRGFLRKFFTGVVPLAAINYWPCAYLLGRSYVPVVVSFLSPLLGVVFLLLGLACWRVGVRHYCSTGS
ncbi:MAG: ABC-2 family transporter protein [Clostridia bacterium]